MDKDNLKYTQNKVNDPLAQPHDSNERVAIYKPHTLLCFSELFRIRMCCMWFPQNRRRSYKSLGHGPIFGEVFLCVCVWSNIRFCVIHFYDVPTMAMHCCELARYSKLFKIQAVWPLIWEFRVISSVCSSFFVWWLFPWHPLTKKLTWLPSLQQFRNFWGYFNPPRTQSNEAPRIVAKDRGHCKVVSQFPISLQVCGFLLSPLSALYPVAFQCSMDLGDFLAHERAQGETRENLWPHTSLNAPIQ